jgi:Mechanosensitive ion channel
VPTLNASFTGGIFVHSHWSFSLTRAVLVGSLVLLSGLALAHPPTAFTPRPAGVVHGPGHSGDLYLNNRHIVTFRTTLLGDSPADRVQLASAALAQALQTSPSAPATVTHIAASDSVQFQVNGRMVFFLVAADAGTPRPEAALAPATLEVQRRLEKAVAETAELRDRQRMAADLAICVAASLAAWLLVRAILWLRRLAAQRLHAALRRPATASRCSRLVTTFSEHVQLVCRLMANAVAWSAVVLTVDAWISFVLLQFAWTRPWGELYAHWLVEVLQHFVSAAIAAVPGLVVAGFIFMIARMVSNANAALMQRVQSGDIQLTWLDAHTALPTRRLCDAVVWLFALAMAYPYLPGAGTDAFKALSVMAGLMLSLGASSAVGQALSGLSLMYSRSLRVGQRVKIGYLEGTVVMLGMFTTRVRTDLGKEVSLPNKMILGRPVWHLSASSDAPASVQEPAQLP